MHSTRWPWRILALAAGAGCAGSPPSPPGPGAEPVDTNRLIIAAPHGTKRPPFSFTPDDERWLDEVQRGAFNYLWNAVAPETGMVRDRTSKPVVSIAGVGFQLSALPVGVERGWVSRDEAAARARKILGSLRANPDNRKAGLFYHFVDGATAGQPAESYEHAVSTIDSALFFAGAITAGEYFGGEVATIASELLAAADWSFFVATPEAVIRGGPARPHEVGFLSLAWRPDALASPSGAGALAPYYWLDSGDEHRLTTLLAVCAPRAEHRVAPELYYRLRRELGSYRDTGPFIWFPFSGALFTNFFAHCWINYAALGPDNPAVFKVPCRARVDWWENSRRAVRMHRLKAIENPRGVPTLGPNAWGLTASDSPTGYAVPGLFPDRVPMLGEREGFDFADYAARDAYGDGTVAPYGAGCAILFDPEAAVAALRHYRGLKAPDGSPLVWRDPKVGGFGFQDAFNIGSGWVAPDCVAIDQGPLILAIENARTGLIWRLFHGHPAVKAGLDRLGLGSPRVEPAVRK